VTILKNTSSRENVYEVSESPVGMFIGYHRCAESHDRMHTCFIPASTRNYPLEGLKGKSARGGI
jgi:hypothetical protein